MLCLSLQIFNDYFKKYINISLFYTLNNIQALQGSVKLEGDVITANGSILSGYEGHDGHSFSESNDSSMCSCRCACFSAKRHKR